MRGEATRIASVLAVAVLVASFLVVGAAGPAVGNTSGDTGSISGGNNFSCAVTSAGTLKCWGGNTYGQLGDGTTAPQNSPQLVPGLGGVAEVSAGWQHVCVLTTVGGVKCWGLNTAGQVGNGTTATAQTTPVDVVGLGSGVQAISTGAFHTCALTDDGGVKCWGHNLQGALGDGTTSDRSSPIDVIGLESGVSAIAAGDSITCAVLDSGALKCWGNNATGGVGDGTTTNRLTPVGVVGLGAGVASVSAEGTYPFGSRTCAVTTSGAAKCWGTNNQGQLGDGTTTNRRIPTDVVGLGSGVAAISTGASFTCARTIVGAVECWGQYAVGADLSGTVVQTTPLDVIGLGSGVVEMEAGGYHACVRLVSGAIKCWGGNNSGQLGIGTDNGAFGRVPLDVSGSFHRPECPTVVPESRTTFTSTDGYAVGSVLTFAADPGFGLTGPADLTCQSDLTIDGVAPGAVSTTEIALEPSTSLVGGQEIEVSLTGFGPGAELGWCQALSDPPIGVGNCALPAGGGTADAAGALSTPFTVRRFVYAPGLARWADCADPAENCVIAAADVADIGGTGVVVPLDIVVPAPPTTRGAITLSPLRVSGPGAPVTVDGTGFRPDTTVEISQCTTAPETPAACNLPTMTVTTDGSGGFTAVSVLTTATVDPPRGDSTACFDPSGACVIAAAESQDFVGTVVSAPLVEVGPVPKVIPGVGLIEENDVGATLVVEVTLTNDWHESIEVPWHTVTWWPTWDPAVFAIEGIDYFAAAGTVTFAPFQTTQTVSIPIIDDAEPEAMELVVVSFKRPTNAGIGGFYGLGFGGLLDDDGT